jgi:M6 family metalloprotease-like protein
MQSVSHGTIGFWRGTRAAGLLAAACLSATLLSAQQEAPPRFACLPGTASTIAAAVPGAGRHITARGTLRVLLVFASFPDDESAHPYWPAHQAPVGMQQFIDPDTATHGTGPFNLTNYFRQMSLGAFQLIGDAVWVESSHSKDEYSNGAYGRANTDILIEKVDPLVDFTQFDGWTNAADYENVNVPDTLVDMIIMVWRTDMFPSVGSATLGFPWSPSFVLDGKKIALGFPEQIAQPVGSGVTCEYLYGDDPLKLMRTMAHEVGHWLLGGSHPYSSDPYTGGRHAYWGMICDGARLSSNANAYERERLGWITIPVILPGGVFRLRDFVTTGDAARFHPPGGETGECFLLENHQRLSGFDDATVNGSDRGLWVLHQRGPYDDEDNLRVVPSDGRWEWLSGVFTSACFGQQLPLFSRGLPAPGPGLSHRDQIPTATSAVNWIFAFRPQGGDISCGTFFAGDGFEGSYHPGGSTVFSPYSNPASLTWGGGASSFSMEVLADSAGVLAVESLADPLDGSPSRRYLGADPSRVRGKDTLALAWGSQWAEGQPLEADIVWSEIERQIGPSGIRDTVYRGPATSWADAGLPYDSAAAVSVHFRVRVRDVQGKYSAWSLPYVTAIPSLDGVSPGGYGEGLPGAMALEQNYPNPFNPVTNVTFDIARSAFVTLKVYDLLGREVAVLVDEIMGPGRYSVRFDGGKNASGMYYYRLNAGGYVATRRMALIR